MACLDSYACWSQAGLMPRKPVVHAANFPLIGKTSTVGAQHGELHRIFNVSEFEMT